MAFFERNRGNTKNISITIRILHVYIKYFIDFERIETVAEKRIKSEKSDKKIHETIFTNDPSIEF